MPVRVPSIVMTGAPIDLRDEAKRGLKDWYSKRYSVEFFNRMPYSEANLIVMAKALSVGIHA